MPAGIVGAGKNHYKHARLPPHRHACTPAPCPCFSSAYSCTCGCPPCCCYPATYPHTHPPTHAGRDLYKRNLQLISPFLLDPFIQLKSLRRLPAGPGGPASWQRGGIRSAAPVQLQAEWLLTCYVALPWRPYVSVSGTTTYTLNEDSNKVGETCGEGLVGGLVTGHLAAAWRDLGGCRSTCPVPPPRINVCYHLPPGSCRSCGTWRHGTSAHGRRCSCCCGHRSRRCGGDQAPDFGVCSAGVPMPPSHLMINSCIF